MQLIDMQFFLYEPSFTHPIRTPKVTMTHRKTLFVKWTDNQQQVWFGECNAFDTAWYHHETIDDVIQVLNAWFENVRGVDLTSFEAAQQCVATLDPFPAARATVIMAMYQMFHKLESFHVPMTLTINGDFTQRMMRIDSVGRIKIKWTPQILEQVKMIATMYPDIPISTDANRTLTMTDSGILERLNPYLAFIEEPFETLDVKGDYAHFPPIAIDEQATCLTTIKNLTQNPNIQTVVLKPFRLGGIDRVLDAMQVLQGNGIRVVIGGMYECGLSRYFTAWLSQWGDYAGDVTPEGFYFEQDVTSNAGRLHNGQLYFEPPVVNQSLLLPL
ncbi:o-succinylbenzoate synthase [Staphylococcus intermedius]|uniref:o-succinylbenzoate synthase n=1 Tax=Staphylococcus intermedius NCTC 11048 TaxID=1141106 RepID=A0A380G813_STAIN|nr:o-succinylbenzoate synthase [Staphylococcus intermedius]PCF64589.1 o-succinylbenzoate synthase [Staphylococcus intermedius]PCF80199.1 o-succinylbenzoate synthase [Staphylococcus intermedius]PCF81549.1 o-succinylbenzoate synthase [Staphylococcus intermedius]PCF84309.1 o-succinylbenzoate synthase [Staphylococcus intermedius]PCF86416.1 o-succinylbenzoate synthase [Staphylococcus intermedius]